MHPLQELEEEHFRAQPDPEFARELSYYLTEFVGRPSPLYFAERLTKELGGAKIYLKREDLNHTGAAMFGMKCVIYNRSSRCDNGNPES